MICIYTPNSERERREFFESLSEYFVTERVIIIIFLDFNCACLPEDRSGQARFRDQSSFYWTDLMTQNTLDDVACVVSEGNVQYTYFQGHSHARQDGVYISLDLLSHCAFTTRCIQSFSDHSLAMFILGNKVKTQKWNWFLWKLNSSLVNDEFFQALVSDRFKTFYENEQEMWWARYELLEKNW